VSRPSRPYKQEVAGSSPAPPSRRTAWKHETARGHLYHRSQISGEPTTARCYQLQTSRADQTEEGYHLGNVLASYAHLHFASEPDLATAFLERCHDFQTAAS
jgi:cobyrinic acid a,c-diamide synthase